MTFLRSRSRALSLSLALLTASACRVSDTLVAPKRTPDALTPARTAYVGGAATVVISQVYGAGGNAGATLRNDFIELYNATTSPVDLTGWSVQYASATGTSWQVTPLSGTLLPGQYYLVQQSQGTGGTVSLPTPDATGTITMGGSAGKVALLRSTTPLSGGGGTNGILVGTSCPSTIPDALVDFVGYGTVTCAETAQTGAISATSSVVRGNGGLLDANNNSTDFTVTTTIAPRNSASPINPVTPQNPVTSVVVNPASNSVVIGATTPFTATARDASNNPTGTTFTWSSSNPAVATIDASTGIATGVSAGIVTITASSSNNVAGTATLTVTVDNTPPVQLPAVRFSEVHYDNAGNDVGEGIEIEAPAGTNLAGYTVTLYSLSGGVVSAYDTRTLSGIVPTLCDGRGVVVLEYPTNGLQNGPNDGMALIDPNGAVVEFLSYEGVLTATIGQSTITSTDIGVAQNGPAVGSSLQRSLAGTWAAAPSNFYGCNGRTPGRQITNTVIAISGRNDDAALPVGFEGQIFADVVNGADRVPFVWSSDTPDIATIDADGVITSKAAGTAVFRVTTTDGLTTATYSLPMTNGVASGTVYVGNAAFGEPTDANPADDFIIRRDEYTTSFNTTRNTPNWVAYNLDQSHIQLGADRCNCFTYDPELPLAKRYTTNEFTGVGAIYNRGHLARSLDRTKGTLDNARTFYFSNIIPQAADNNQGPWAAFETYLGNLALTSDKEIYIVTGVAGNIGTLKNEGDVVIPEYVWKVAVIMNRDQGLADFTSPSSGEVISVIMPNVNGIRNVPWQTYQSTVQAVQQLSGYDLLAALSESVECKVEVRNCLPEPVLVSATGSASVAAGTPFVLNTSATDADGANGPWRYVLEWGDGTSFTTTLAALPSSTRPLARAKTYTAPGTYTARLTVTDKNGGKGVQTFVITVN